MLQHMVNPRRHSNNRKGGKRKEKTSNREDTMVFGDNVRARMAARALPRTPTTEEEKEEENGEDKQRDHAHHQPPAIPTHT